MNKYMILSIRVNDVPVYGEIEADNIRDCIYQIVGFLFDQKIDGENHLSYLLENENYSLKFMDESEVALLSTKGENTYISTSKEKLFDYAIQNDYRIEKNNYIITNEES